MLKNPWLKLINNFSEVTGYSINKQKSTLFWNRYKEKLRNGIKEHNSIYISIKRMKYLETKEVQDWYTKNCKHGWGKLNNKCRDTPCSQIGRDNTAKKAILSQLIYRFNQMLIKILAGFSWKFTRWFSNSNKNVI